MALPPLSALAYLELTLEARSNAIQLRAFLIRLQYDPSSKSKVFTLIMSYLSSTGTVVYYLLYPILLVLQALLTVLLFLAAPLIHLGHYIAYACWWPFHFLAKFEVCHMEAPGISATADASLDAIHFLRSRSNCRGCRGHRPALCIRLPRVGFEDRHSCRGTASEKHS